MVLDAASITADDEHSGSGYKAFKKFIFEQCPDAKNTLGKYGIQDIVSTGYEIHHMNGYKTHYIERGHSHKYYSELKKLISDNNISEITITYKYNKNVNDIRKGNENGDT